MILDKHWWHTADRSELVPHGDERAAFLAYPKGMEIPDDTARKLGILTPEPEPEPASADAADAKAKAAPPNKARTATANKQGS